MNRLGRRQFLVVAGTVLAAPLARAQQPRRIYRVVILTGTSRQSFGPMLDALEQGLRDHGYLPGKDVVVELHSTEGNLERLPEAARDVVRSKPDVIVTGLHPTIVAAKAATQSIPIVMALGREAVSSGYAKSLARPGGNITGIQWAFDGGLISKRIELLKEIIPKISLVATYLDPPYRDSQFKDAIQMPVEDAARALGLRSVWHDYSDDPERDFAEMTRLGVDAVNIMPHGPMFARRADIFAQALKHRLPTTSPAVEFVEAGGLISYGVSLTGAYRAAGKFIDKILKGANPGDLPIEQAAVYELAINLKTAKAFGLKVPQSLLLRATRVIE